MALLRMSRITRISVFVRLRGIAFLLTFILTLASVALLGVKGLNLGVDFVGGLMIEAHFEKPVELDTLRRDINRLNIGEASLQQIGTNNNVSIRLPLPPGDESASQKVVKIVQTSLSQQFPNVHFERVDTVSGKVSGELMRSGIIAVLLAIAGIVIFTWLRFEWQFAVSTFVSVAHDVLVILGFLP